MSEPVKRERRQSAPAGTRGVLAGAALLLPSLTLIPLGGLYLWEHGLLLWWALFALACVATLTGALKWILRAPVQTAEHVSPAGHANTHDADAYWGPQERRAWDDVVQIAVTVDPEKITSLDSFVALGQQTLDAVARRLHPEKSDALWQFTMPEALAIVERVSRRLGGFVVQSVPFGDRLTVAQILAAYRWRGMFDVAERAYDIWRIVRMVNPMTAVTNEARERLTRSVLNYGKEHVSRRIAEAFVEEVGRAAIDLYGGRLAVAHRLSTADAANDPLSELSTRPVALNIMVAGSTRSDRLALATLLSEVAAKRELTILTAPASLSTALAEPLPSRDDSVNIEALSEELQDADILIWIVTGAPEDQRALAALAAKIKSRGDSAVPALVPVSLHGAQGLERGHLIAESLALARAIETIPADMIAIPDLDLAHPEALAPLLDAVKARMVTARRVHIQRTLSQARRASGWTSSARQALKAAGALTRAVARRGRG